MGFSELKAAKEAFVTGHTGTSMHEVVLVTLIGPVTVVLLRVVQAHWLQQANWYHLLLLELLVLVAPTIVAFTQPDIAPWLMLGMLAAAAAVHARQWLGTGRRSGYLEVPNLWAPPAQQGVVTARLGRSSRPRFLSHYRGDLLLGTIISILAVDFTIFPRRFAKCESFGVSLMDCGVGSFVFANALVSRQARRVSSGRRAGLTSVLRAAKSVAPLLVLGLVRLGVNKALQYQEHVSEYGVHWNFFFTMATVAVLSALVEVAAGWVWKQVPTSFYVATSVVVCAVYQVALYLGLEDYILSAPRDNLFSQNREGILGSAGFLALFMLGVAVGRCLNHALYHRTPWPKLLSLIAGAALSAWGAATMADAFVAPVSRRMTNASYVIWILAGNLVHLAALLVAELVWALPTQPPVAITLGGLNENGLALFLLANVLTGVVNMSMVTIYAAPPLAYAVVCAYTAAVATAAAGLYRRVKLKVW